MSIFGSNYPPGVTGNEPAITGEYPVDLHNPYEAGDQADSEHELWPVWDARDEDLPPGSEHRSQQEAEAVANALNAMIPPCQQEFEKGCCVICGEPDMAQLAREHTKDREEEHVIEEHVIDLNTRRYASEWTSDDEGPQAA